MDAAAVRSHIAGILDMPVFLIFGHACLCPAKGKCYESPPQPDPPVFQLPDGVILQSWVTPGESYICLKSYNSLHIYQHQTELLQYLYHHDTSDIKIDNSVKFSFYDGLKRAAGGVGSSGDAITYPNISFSFNPDEGMDATTNIFGVYRLDTFPDRFTNKDTSIIKQNPAQPNNSWFLKDIIDTVRREEDVYKALFILAGCFGACGEEMEPDEYNELEKLVDTADLNYPTIMPTFTQREMKEMGLDSLIIHEHKGYPIKKRGIHPNYALKSAPELGFKYAKEEIFHKNIAGYKQAREEYRRKILSDLFTSARPSATGPRAQKARKSKSKRRASAVKTMKQRILRNKSAMKTKSKKRLLSRVKRATTRILPAWARNWLRRHKG